MVTGSNLPNFECDYFCADGIDDLLLERSEIDT